jgi:hypothetical protein
MSTAREINRLHADVVRQSAASKEALHAALAAAWRAGQLLIAEKKRIWKTMGRGAWLPWLEENFHAQPRTAQNYMRLAADIAEVSSLEKLSLRQAYLQLGIATEPKCRAESPRVAQLPSHVRLANRLMAALKPWDEYASEATGQSAAVQNDLRALYERLRRLFESEQSPNLSGASRSKPVLP